MNRPHADRTLGGPPCRWHPDGGAKQSLPGHPSWVHLRLRPCDVLIDAHAERTQASTGAAWTPPRAWFGFSVRTACGQRAVGMRRPHSWIRINRCSTGKKAPWKAA